MAELTQVEIEDWIINKATGKFHYTKIMDGLIKPELYPQLRAILHRCKEKGIAVPVDGRDGWWRAADLELEEVCWWDGDGEIGDNLLLPLGLGKYCYIPLPSLVLVAGKYNAGKTAMLINIVNHNLEKWANRLDFYVSEGAEMMRAKFANLNSYIPKPPPFKMYRRTQNFADVIKPDRLSVIDYLRVDMEKAYAASNKLFEIFNKLEKGIAVIAMQKPPGERKLAFGGASTAFEPSLYLSMDSISKHRSYVAFEKFKVIKPLDFDPYQLKIEFDIDYGVHLNNVVEVIG